MLVSLGGASSFDQPRSKRIVDLGPSPSGFGARIKVSCYLFSKFMVKQVDTGEKGAERLAIIPVAQDHVPRCTRARDKAEVVINPDDWSGYFKGVKNDLVFFDADDGMNGGLPFAVYDAKTGKKVFEDSALGSLDFTDAVSDSISLRYLRVLESDCNMLQDAAGCWAQIEKTTGLENTPAPDCKTGYERSAQEMAKGRCQAQKSKTPQCLAKEIQLAHDQANSAPSVVAYPVEVVLDAKPVTKPVVGKVQCWPMD